MVPRVSTRTKIISQFCSSSVQVVFLLRVFEATYGRPAHYHYYIITTMQHLFVLALCGAAAAQSDDATANGNGDDGGDGGGGGKVSGRVVGIWIGFICGFFLLTCLCRCLCRSFWGPGTAEEMDGIEMMDNHG